MRCTAGVRYGEMYCWDEIWNVGGRERERPGRQPFGRANIIFFCKNGIKTRCGVRVALCDREWGAPPLACSSHSNGQQRHKKAAHYVRSHVLCCAAGEGSGGWGDWGIDWSASVPFIVSLLLLGHPRAASGAGTR